MCMVAIESGGGDRHLSGPRHLVRPPTNKLAAWETYGGYQSVDEKRHDPGPVILTPPQGRRKPCAITLGSACRRPSLIQASLGSAASDQAIASVSLAMIASRPSRFTKLTSRIPLKTPRTRKLRPPLFSRHSRHRFSSSPQPMTPIVSSSSQWDGSGRVFPDQ